MKATLYHAMGCAPSTMLRATLASVLEDGSLPDLDLTFCRLEEDRAPFVAAGIRATPTLVVERESGPLVLIGAISRAKLLAELA